MSQSCYCGTRLRPDGACPYRCPLEAKPSYIRAERAKARARDAHAAAKAQLLSRLEVNAGIEKVAPMARAMEPYRVRGQAASRKRWAR